MSGHEPPSQEVIDQITELLSKRDTSVLVCYTKCWSCQFGEHASEWHTWADGDDVAHALATGQADPSSQKCGCYCQKDAPPAGVERADDGRGGDG